MLRFYSVRVFVVLCVQQFADTELCYAFDTVERVAKILETGFFFRVSLFFQWKMELHFLYNVIKCHCKRLFIARISSFIYVIV